MTAPYSEAWKRTFLSTVPADQTDDEVAFLLRRLPPLRFRRVLDVCCGLGRHAVRLARAGYSVTGIDLDPGLLQRAERAAPEAPEYVQADMRDLEGLERTFDAALVLWASFGYFTSEVNDQVARGLRRRLVPGGRLLLDLYHPDFFEAHQGSRTIERGGRRVTESKHVDGRRLTVELDYGDGETDRFTWELLHPDRLSERFSPFGLTVVGLYAAFQEEGRPSKDQPRYQALFEAR